MELKEQLAQIKGEIQGRLDQVEKGLRDFVRVDRRGWLSLDVDEPSVLGNGFVQLVIAMSALATAAVLFMQKYQGI